MKGNVCIAVLVLFGCGSPASDQPPLPLTPASEQSGAAVIRTPVPQPAPAQANAQAVPPSARSAAGATIAIAAPAGAIYVCVSAPPELAQTAIEFSPSVADLCRRHPEMGPCQYEREACRRSGGRVFAADGSEITRKTEDEYDKHVMRIRLRSN